jgi:hypothetical protein
MDPLIGIQVKGWRPLVWFNFDHGQTIVSFRPEVTVLERQVKKILGSGTVLRR